MVIDTMLLFYFFFFKQKTAYEMRISDWSSDVCSSDLIGRWWRRCRGGVSLRTRRKTSGSGFPCHLLTAISRSTQAMGQEFQQAIVLVENIHAFSRHAAGAGDAIRQNTRCNIRMGGQRRGSSHSGKRQAGSLILRQAEPRCGPGKCVDKAEGIGRAATRQGGNKIELCLVL